MREGKQQLDAPDLTEEKVNPAIFEAPEGYTEDSLRSIMQRVRAKKVNVNNPIEEPELLIAMGEAPILRKGSLCFVCGQAGSRKTSALTLVCADMMRPGHIQNSPFTIKRPLRILYIDPEQHEGDTQRINLKIRYLIGSDEGIDTYPLIEFPTEVLPYIIEQLLKSGNYDVCVIDNVAQLGKGIVMDIDRAEELVRNLRRLAVIYDCGFFGVIHMNEGQRTNRPRGHGGAEAVREGDLVWQFIEDNGKTFSVAEALKARLMKPQKWGVAIRTESVMVNGKSIKLGVPYYCNASVETKTTPKKTNPDKYTKYLDLLPLTGISANDLGRAIDKLEGKDVKKGQKPSRSAYTIITQMSSEEVGLIIKMNGLYYATDKAPEESPELPF